MAVNKVLNLKDTFKNFAIIDRKNVSKTRTVKKAIVIKRDETIECKTGNFIALDFILSLRLSVNKTINKKNIEKIKTNGKLGLFLI